MYITICEIDDQCKSMHEAGHSKQVLWDNPDRWIRKLWYIYIIEYYSVIKNNTFESVLMR